MPYGVRKLEQGCCPGHDQVPGQGRVNNKKARQRYPKKRARHEAKLEFKLLESAGMTLRSQRERPSSILGRSMED